MADNSDNHCFTLSSFFVKIYYKIKRVMLPKIWSSHDFYKPYCVSLTSIVKLWAIYNVPLSRSRGRVGSVPVHAAHHLPALRLPPRLRRIHASPGMGQDSMQLQSFFCISSEAIVYDAELYVWIVHWSEGLSLNNLHNYIALLWNSICLKVIQKIIQPIANSHILPKI